MGYGLFAIGYVIFYWGLHHPPFKQDRYSLWTLFGVGNAPGSLFKTSTANWPGPPVPIGFDVSGGAGYPPPPPPKSAPPKSAPQRHTPANPKMGTTGPPRVAPGVVAP